MTWRKRKGRDCEATSPSAVKRRMHTYLRSIESLDASQGWNAEGTRASVVLGEHFCLLRTISPQSIDYSDGKQVWQQCGLFATESEPEGFHSVVSHLSTHVLLPPCVSHGWCLLNEAQVEILVLWRCVVLDRRHRPGRAGKHRRLGGRCGPPSLPRPPQPARRSERNRDPGVCVPEGPTREASTTYALSIDTPLCAQFVQSHHFSAQQEQEHEHRRGGVILGQSTKQETCSTMLQST